MANTHRCEIDAPHDKPSHSWCEPTNAPLRKKFYAYSVHRQLAILRRSEELFDGTRRCCDAWKQAMAELAPDESLSS